MHWLSFILAATSAYRLHLVSAISSGGPIVNLGYAQYRGNLNLKEGNIEFLGIRYGAAPTGNARWRKPRPPERVHAIQIANAQPHRCQQVETRPEEFVNQAGESRGDPSKTSKPPLSEDCLFLNVVAPGLDFEQTSQSKLPVIVWIHGGGYSFGSISTANPNFTTSNYDGNDIVREAQGQAIVVLIQYRLGLFGFLAGSDVKRHGTLNAGLLDQQYALQWVQQHISKFGGDPGKVTIWGQSAGAGSVVQHLIANGGKTKPPLFRAGILSSIYLPPQYEYNERIPEALYAEVVEKARCTHAHNHLDCLRNVSASELMDISTTIERHILFGSFAFVPVVDGEFIQQRPTLALKEGKINAQNVLAFTNTAEGRIFIDPQAPSSLHVQDYVSQLFPLLKPDQLNLVAEMYERFGDPYDQVVQIMGDAIFVCPTYFILAAVKGTRFKGEFAIPPANHVDDVIYYFPSLLPSEGPPFNNPSFVHTFTGSFMDFARHMDPNIYPPKSVLPHWTQWDIKTAQEMIFNRTGDAANVHTTSTSRDLLRRCEVWESMARWTRQ